MKGCREQGWKDFAQHPIDSHASCGKGEISMRGHMKEMQIQYRIFHKRGGHVFAYIFNRLTMSAKTVRLQVAMNCQICV